MFDRLQSTLELLWSIHFDGWNFDYEKWNRYGTCPRPSLFKFQQPEDFES